MEEMLDTIQDTISELKSLFNNAPDLGIAIRKYIEENAGLKKQVEDYMKEKEASLKERLLKNIQEIHGIKVIKFCAPLPAEVVKNIAFQLRGEITENLFFVAGSLDNGKPMLTVMLSDNLVAGGLESRQPGERSSQTDSRRRRRSTSFRYCRRQEYRRTECRYRKGTGTRRYLKKQ